MRSITPHAARTAAVQHAHHTAPHGHAASHTMHPERAAVVGHLHHMHSMMTSPGMAAHPITPSEGHMLSSGAEQLTRAANSVA